MQASCVDQSQTESVQFEDSVRAQNPVAHGDTPPLGDPDVATPGRRHRVPSDFDDEGEVRLTLKRMKTKNQPDELISGMGNTEKSKAQVLSLRARRKVILEYPNVSIVNLANESSIP